MEILMFFANIVPLLPLLGLIPTVILGIIFLKGCNWVTFPYVGLKEKQRLQQEYDFVPINRLFGAILYLPQTVLLTVAFVTNMVNPNLWWVSMLFMIPWAVGFALHTYIVQTKRFCDRFRRTAQTE
ncbi:MAG: hypothetical protein FWG64_00700 [Firmicutes bacterium]|nr:hypothetical protein [Bacillota bacterium]